MTREDRKLLEKGLRKLKKAHWHDEQAFNLKKEGRDIIAPAMERLGISEHKILDQGTLQRVTVGRKITNVWFLPWEEGDTLEVATDG